MPKNVTRSASAKSNSEPDRGWVGDPSYITSVAPDASAETCQFHIIQPHVVK